MKKALAAAVIAATALSSTSVAVAKGKGHGHGHHKKHHGHYEKRHHGYGHHGYGQRDYGYRHSYGYAQPYHHGYAQPYGYGYPQPSYGYSGYGGGYRHGQVFPYYNRAEYVVHDYGRYDLPPPRPGYRYYRSGNGDVVMAAIVGGVIGLVVVSALRDRGRHDGYYGGYGRRY